MRFSIVLLHLRMNLTSSTNGIRGSLRSDNIRESFFLVRTHNGYFGTRFPFIIKLTILQLCIHLQAKLLMPEALSSACACIKGSRHLSVLRDWQDSSHLWTPSVLATSFNLNRGHNFHWYIEKFPDGYERQENSSSVASRSAHT